MLPRIFNASNDRLPSRRRLSALWLAIIYTVVACSWILFSDRLLLVFVSDLEQFSVLATYKGWAFVLASALLLYLERSWSERERARIDRMQQQQHEERALALELSQAQLQVIMDHAPVIFYMRDLEGRYIWVNRGWEQQTGHSADSAIGATPDTLFVPETAALIMQNQRDVLARQEASVEEVRLTLKGEARFFIRAVFPLTTATGEPYAVAGIMTDITERRSIEQSLRNAEARYRTLFNVAAIGIAIEDAQGNFVDVNPTLANMLGYDVSGLKAMSCWDITAAGDTSDEASLFAQMVQGATDQYVLEKQYQRADGQIVWARLTESVLQRDEGRGLFLAVIEDITARREIEVARQQMQEELAEQVAARTAELRQLNINLAEAQRLAHVGSLTVDRHADRVIGSEETNRIWGLPRDTQSVSLTELRAMVHPDDLMSIREIVSETATENGILNVELRIIRPDGTQRYVQLRSDIQRDEQGKPTRLFGSLQDITERKEAEIALHELNERLSALIEASPLAILVVRTDGIITHWNAAAERIYGYKNEEIVGTKGDILGAPEEVDALAQRDLMTQGATLSDLETKRIRADGTMIDVSISTAPIYDEQGQVTGVVVIVADITDRKRAEAELRLLNQELEMRVAERTQHLEQEIAERRRAEAEVLALNETLAAQAASLESVNKELETFTYSVSHDLKAPLRGLDGYSRLLQDGYAELLDEDGRFFIQSIRRASEQMAQLIDDLLAYSRIERRQLQTIEIDLQRLVTSLIAQIKHELPNQQIEFVENLTVTHIKTDPDALTFALRNLIDNAIKFSAQRDKPCIEVGSCAVQHGWRLYVQDNGIGFDMQYRDRIFEIFQRLHRAEDYPGTGIGLAIVRKAVQRLHGEIWAESQIDEGTTFTMEFLDEPTEQADSTH